MRCARIAIVIGLSVSVLAPRLFAQSFSVQDDNPKKYDDVKNTLEKEIPDKLSEAKCGGWVNDAGTVEKYISTVPGDTVPGRVNDWDGAKFSAMGSTDTNGNSQRADDFVFPTDTKGLTTVCEPGKDRISKTQWVLATTGKPGTGAADNGKTVVTSTIEYPHPEFADPPCRWRRKEDGQFVETPPSVPLRPLQDYDEEPEYEEMDDTVSQDPRSDVQSPPNCVNFCRYVNRYQYQDCLLVLEDVDENDNPISVCMRWGKRYLCSERIAPDAEDVAACQPGAPTTEKPNAKSCLGKTCECSLKPEDTGKGMCETVLASSPTDPSNVSPLRYASYYRAYGTATDPDTKGVKYERTKLPGLDTDTDRASNEASVACFGFYKEFDPYHKKTVAEDRRCVINIDVKDYRESQNGKGEYESDVPDRDPNEDVNQRSPTADRAPGDYDEEADVWYLKLGSAFSLLSEKAFEEKHGKDLASAYMTLDNASEKATVQLTEAKPLAISNMIRGGDDTGTGRIVEGWWQKQQTEVSSLMHPSVVRIVLPSTYAFGIDPNDPFFGKVKTASADPIERRNDRIELQINAEEDILGKTLEYLERSLLLDVVEEPIPVVVPMGSATEFRTRANEWCLWHMNKTGDKNCDNAEEPVKKVMTALSVYADNVDEVRELRAELPRYAASVLNLQQQLTKPISEWMKENLNNYRAVLREQRQLRQNVGQQWRQIQEKMNSFNNETNTPWCMNQRFTSPVYSLLDEWLPSRDLNARISADNLPNITVPPMEDVIIDFSTIAFLPNTITIPVLKPVQVRITDFPRPTDAKEHNLDPTKTYPDLPTAASIRTSIRSYTNNLPKVADEPEPIPPIDLKPMGATAALRVLATMTQIRSTLEKMNDRYDKFWKSIGPLKEGEEDTEIEKLKTKLECTKWDDDVCQHVEMDLMERFVRIGSRPNALLPEDYIPQKRAQGFGGVCLPEEETCTLAHPESEEQHILEIIGPETKMPDAETIRGPVRDLTLPRGAGNIPTENLPPYTVEPPVLVPIYDVPLPLDLTPAASSSSSSS